MKTLLALIVFVAFSACGGDGGGDDEGAAIADALGIPPTCRGGDAIADNGSRARGGDANCVGDDGSIVPPEDEEEDEEGEDEDPGDFSGGPLTPFQTPTPLFR